MNRIHQFVFVVSLFAISWLGMMAIHELGHVIGAVATGGSVQRVVLSTFSFSRTDVSPNPSPTAVVWLGPIVGCLIPLLVWYLVPSRYSHLSAAALFFTGFCMIANGAYISFGAVDGVGDSGVMLQHGTPSWALVLFGTLTIPFGLYAWHRLGSIKDFLANPTSLDRRIGYYLLAVLALLVAAEISFSRI